VGIAPGGVPLAYEVARALDAPLEAWAARQIHAPHTHAEHVGAIAEDGHRAFSLEAAPAATRTLPHEHIRALAEAEHEALLESTHHIRNHPRTSMRNHTILLVDDGIATGATLRAAVRAIRQEKPHRVVAAVAVVARGALENVDRWVDDVVFLHECDEPADMTHWYAELHPVEDAVVAHLLDLRRQEMGAHTGSRHQ